MVGRIPEAHALLSMASLMYLAVFCIAHVTGDYITIYTRSALTMSICALKTDTQLVTTD